MNKVEAIKAMLEGEKVRRDNWEKYRYIYLDKYGDFMSEDGDTEDLNKYNFTGWKIYEEPKKKMVDKYLWAYRQNGKWYITTEFYPENQIFTDESETIFKLEFSKITVEED